MEGSRVRLDRMVSIVEISGVERILDVSFRASSSPIGMGVPHRFLSNSVALTGMFRRASIFNSEVESLVPEWGYARDAKGCLEKVLGMPWEEVIGSV